MRVYPLKTNYRIVNPVKFVVSFILSSFIAIALLGGIYVGASHLYEKFIVEPQIARMAMPIPAPTFTFNYGNVNIQTQDKEEYTNLLKQALTDKISTSNQKDVEYANNIQMLQTKYTQSIKKTNQVTLADFKLYNDYSYVLYYPNSDFTLADVKMVIAICKQEKINPHVWFALVQLESSYNSSAKSDLSTASGWGQVLAGTGSSIYENDLKLGTYNHDSMGTDKEINAKISIHYLSTLIDKWGVEQGLINYNGDELGPRYVSIIENNLQKNTGKTLTQLSGKKNMM
jgi:hypothetical protein